MRYENDVSAEKTSESQGTRFPKKDADVFGAGCTQEKKIEGQEKLDGINVAAISRF